MTVYVDQPIYPHGQVVVCHMWADTQEELLAMVDAIGVNRKWIQGHPTLSLPVYRTASWVHFDISKAKRQLAIAAGAHETDRLGPVDWLARGDTSSQDPARALIAAARLARVLDRRARAIVPAVLA